MKNPINLSQMLPLEEKENSLKEKHASVKKKNDYKQSAYLFGFLDIGCFLLSLLSSSIILSESIYW